MSSFLWNININQKAVIDNKLDLDINDVAIIYFLIVFSASKNCVSLECNGKRYYWFSTGLIKSNLPLLRIGSERGIYKRITNLIESQLLERHPDNQRLGKSFYCFTAKTDLLVFSPFEQKAQGANESSEPVNESSEQTFTPPMNFRSDNNSIKDHCIKENKSLSLWGDFLNEQIPVFKKNSDVTNLFIKIDSVRPGVFSTMLQRGADLNIEIGRFSNRIIRKKLKIDNPTIQGFIAEFRNWLEMYDPSMDRSKVASIVSVPKTKGFVIGERHNAVG
jgi:hypothetical protein